MATNRVITATNFTPPTAPPVAFTPGINGRIMPAGFKTWTLTWDGANLSVGVPFDFQVEYHYSVSGWQLDVGGAGVGGLFIDDVTGLPTNIRVLQSTIGSVDDQGRLILYPDLIRIKWNKWPAGISIPTLTIDLFS